MPIVIDGSPERREPGGQDAAIGYAFEILLGPQAAELRRGGRLRYGASPEGSTSGVDLLPSGFFGRSFSDPQSLPTLPLGEIDGVPLLFGEPEVLRHGSRLVVHADLAASSYFLLTRYEELARPQVRDRHGRFLGVESLPHRAGFLGRPLVDEYGVLLRRWLREAGVPVSDPERRFSVVLTHDVDQPRLHRRPWRETLQALAGRRPRTTALATLLRAAGLRRDPYDTFPWMIEQDGRLSAAGGPPSRAIYFFMANGTHALDRTYDVRAGHLRRLIRRVHASGAEVGLHASYSAGIDPARIAEERALLEEVAGSPVRSSRHHYLGLREAPDARQLHAAGIEHDYTLGYPDVIGFRLGVCHPVPLFDPVAREPTGVTEHPLLVMDCALDWEENMGLSEERAMEQCRSVAEQTRRHQGELVLLWHNTAFAKGAGYHRALYGRWIGELAPGGSPGVRFEGAPAG